MMDICASSQPLIRLGSELLRLSLLWVYTLTFTLTDGLIVFIKATFEGRGQGVGHAHKVFQLSEEHQLNKSPRAQSGVLNMCREENLYYIIRY